MKYKNKLMLSLLLVANTGAYAEVENGGFETWSNSAPSGWTTIDTGIAVNENKISLS